MKNTISYLAFFLLLLTACSPHTTSTAWLTPGVGPINTPVHSLSSATAQPTISSSPLPNTTSSPIVTSPTSPTVPTVMASSTKLLAPTQAVQPLEPLIDTDDSISFINWSPDANWLAYFDFKDNTLHFYNPLSRNTCAYPNPLDWLAPLGPLRWTGNETALIQDGSRLVAGQPCNGVYVPSSSTIQHEAFTRQDPAISPDGRYKAETHQNGSGAGLLNFHGTITDRQTGQIVWQDTYSLPACGGCGQLLGEWLNNDTLLISSTADQGPMLVFTDKRGYLIPSGIFNQAQNGQPQADWRVTGAPVTGTNAYHLLLTSASQPDLMLLYHSETGQIEKLTPPTSFLSFSQDGRWLVDSRPTANGQGLDVLVRPVDPPGSPWSQLSGNLSSIPAWSPDDRVVMTASADQARLALISPRDGRTIQTWRNTQYELVPGGWSPDGAFFVAAGRQAGNYSHHALFLIQVSPPAPVTLRSPPLPLPYGLAVDEYRLQDKPGFAPDSDNLDFKPAGTSMEAVLDKHAFERASAATLLYYANNTALRPFGYRLATDSWAYGQISNQAVLWRLYRYDTLVLSDIFSVGPVSVGDSGQDFVMTAQLADRSVLVRKGAIEDFPDLLNHRVGMLGDDLLEAIDHPESPAGYVEVKRAGKVIQTIPTAFGGPLLDFMGLWTYQNHWHIEVLSKLDLALNNPVGDIYADGVSLNQSRGYQDSFNFAYLNDQPFYFYKKGGKIGISYAGQEIPLDYDQVLHDGCCSAGVFNPRVSPLIVSFFAERDGAWYYVEAH